MAGRFNPGKDVNRTLTVGEVMLNCKIGTNFECVICSIFQEVEVLQMDQKIWNAEYFQVAKASLI